MSYKIKQLYHNFIYKKLEKYIKFIMNSVYYKYLVNEII